MTQLQVSLADEIPSNSSCASSNATRLARCPEPEESPLTTTSPLTSQADVSDSTVNSSIGQRLIQETNGPFNKEPSGVTIDIVTSEENVLKEKNVDESLSELYSFLPTDDNMLPTITDRLWQSFDMLDVKNMDCSADLSEFFIDCGLLKVAEADGLESQLPSTSAHPGNISGRKRRHESLEELHSLANDHDGYTKTKFARVSSTTSDTDSEICSSSEAGDKHIVRRLKNNIASRRSRQTRKQKYVDMEKKAKELEQINAELKERANLLEELAKEMKNKLLNLMKKSMD